MCDDDDPAAVAPVPFDESEFNRCVSEGVVLLLDVKRRMAATLPRLLDKTSPIDALDSELFELIEATTALADRAEAMCCILLESSAECIEVQHYCTAKRFEVTFNDYCAGARKRIKDHTSTLAVELAVPLQDMKFEALLAKVNLDVNPEMKRARKQYRRVSEFVALRDDRTRRNSWRYTFGHIRALLRGLAHHFFAAQLGDDWDLEVFGPKPLDLAAPEISILVRELKKQTLDPSKIFRPSILNMS